MEGAVLLGQILNHHLNGRQLYIERWHEHDGMLHAIGTCECTCCMKIFHLEDISSSTDNLLCASCSHVFDGTPQRVKFQMPILSS